MTHISYNEGTRAPTSMELGCANPGAPCKLPNSMAGDPPLKQVISRTLEVGGKGFLTNNLGWSASSYYTLNESDIQFIATGTSSTALGYFANIGQTQRTGFDLGLSGKSNKFSWQASLSQVIATYESAFQANVANNLYKGKVKPGNEIPGIPEWQLKLRGSFQITPSWDMGANIIAFSSQYLQGNENNGYYVKNWASSPTSNFDGNGKAGGYAIMNLDSKYKFGNSGWQVFAKITNVFDRDYYTGGLQGASMFDPRTNGYMGDDSRMSLMAPGSPRAGWMGLRWEFGGAKDADLNKD